MYIIIIDDKSYNTLLNSKFEILYIKINFKKKKSNYDLINFFNVLLFFIAIYKITYFMILLSL